ncbi:hypothetical protein [Bacteroides sp. 224]|uniref:hypothetical protein n=1 Tax=Bacteroides sp. 224 TaxID=2302936 RepID=UPI0013D503FB|nr:hypothetical protein [Bacteroides sp. 224]NDV64972.1 hypothetical protein [Bacteroides sp. 224]
MKLLAVVITYYPDLALLRENILKYIDFVDKLVIWENTPVFEREKYSIHFADYENKIMYKGTMKNEGIAYPLNVIAKWGIEKGYSHLLTMDQDSLFNDFRKYIYTVGQNVDQNNPMCYTPNPNNRFPKNGNIFYLDPITSGAIYDLRIFSVVGFFKEQYFIDAIDTEFCYRCHINDVKTLLISDSLIIQRFGDTSKTKFGIYISNYSSFRIYYIIRNHIFLWREYSHIMPKDKKKWFFYSVLLKWPFKILLLEKNKKVKIESYLKGLLVGLFTRIERRL